MKKLQEELIEQILEQLRNGELKEYFIQKDEFLTFRKTLVKQKDFKHFQGIAQRGGDVLYRYLEEARS